MRAHDAMTRAAGALHAAGLPSPVTDARLLLTHVLGSSHALLIVPGLTDAERTELNHMVSRRAAGEPLQHITGVAPFRYEELRVGPGVFIPRPETELLVEEALHMLAARPVGQRRVVELCAGSGAITLSLAKELGGLQLHAVEISDSAWPYLVNNLDGIDVELVHGDMADAFHELDGLVDLVIANPPYVPEMDREVLPSDVVGGDPEGALFSGPEGMDALRAVHDVSRRLLRPGGWVMAEHDEKQSTDVVELFAAPHFRSTVDHRDLNDRPRYVVAQRSDETQRVGVAGLAP